jgi:hypothetical protein
VKEVLKELKGTLPKLDLAAYQGAHDGVKDIPEMLKEALAQFQDTGLREMFGAISVWHTYCHGNPNTEFVFTKRAAEELFRAVMPFGTHVMSTKENKRYKQLADESSEINPDMPAEQMKATRLTIEQTKSMHAIW